MDSGYRVPGAGPRIAFPQGRRQIKARPAPGLGPLGEFQGRSYGKFRTLFDRPNDVAVLGTVQVDGGGFPCPRVRVGPASQRGEWTEKQQDAVKQAVLAMHRQALALSQRLAFGRAA